MQLLVFFYNLFCFRVFITLLYIPIDATLKRFKTYHRRKSLDQPSRAEKLTANHVKFVMRTEFANQYTLMKKKLGL